MPSQEIPYPTEEELEDFFLDSRNFTLFQVMVARDTREGGDIDDEPTTETQELVNVILDAASQRGIDFGNIPMSQQVWSS